MCKTARYKELSLVLSCKFYSYITSKSRRTLSYIHCYIPYRTTDYSNELRLCIRRLLEVQPPKYPLGGFGFIVLNKGSATYILYKSLLRERLKEISPIISKDLGFYNNNTFYICLYNIHYDFTKSNKYCP